jgi:CRISPR-associated protein Cas1
MEAKQRFIDLIRGRFNAGVPYKGRVLRWDTVIEQKTEELGRFLTGKSSTLDFVEPAPKLEKQDGRELRTKILSLTQSEARELGIGKSTLHYLRRNARSTMTFSVHENTRKKLESSATEGK